MLADLLYLSARSSLKAFSAVIGSGFVKGTSGSYPASGVVDIRTISPLGDFSHAHLSSIAHERYKVSTRSLENCAHALKLPSKPLQTFLHRFRRVMICTSLWFNRSSVVLEDRGRRRYRKEVAFIMLFCGSLSRRNTL